MHKLDPSKRPKDKMDRLIQEAQEEGLFHGRLKRSLLAGYEGHQQAKWMQRAGSAMIVGVLVVLITAWIGWPVPVVGGLFGVCALASAICFGIGVYHLVRYVTMEARVDKGSGDDDAPSDAPAHSSHSDVDGSR